MQRAALYDFVKKRPWVLAVGTVLIIVLGFVYLLFWAPNTTPLASEQPVTIPRGASFKAVLDSLESSGVLRTRWTLKLAGRILGKTRTMKIGRYLFPSGLSNVELLEDLEGGTSRILVPVLVPEGWRMERIAIRYAQVLGLDLERFIRLCDNPSFLAELGVDGSSLEGYLMPDTYRFLWQTDEREVIERMVREFKSFYADSLSRRQAELKMKLNEVLALASIVEAETQLDHERPIVAGVYLNRLKKRMRLEADPTIQYALPDGPRRLLYSDLRLESPYNTYRIFGLPPGPINSPGRKSILAVLYPEKHSYLYFVANGAGGHTFSRTYAEHRKAVQTFRRLRREAQRSSGSSR
ncbi:MAG: endolytic transglycosylase MltG [Ignavibacteria bacterium]|nr:endolytic transglycosylase MltG [Ignavibacteria bacterium]